VRRVWLWILLIVLAGGAFWGTLHILDSPRWALYQIGTAINDHNPRLFLAYVDVDTIVRGQKDTIVELVVPRDKNDQKTRNMVRGLVGAFMEPLSDQVKIKIIKAIEDTERNDLPTSWTLAVAAQVVTNQDYALVVLSDPESKRRLRLGMQRKNDGPWRVVNLNSRDLKLLVKEYLGEDFGKNQ
jgi:DUF2939 family protein